MEKQRVQQIDIREATRIDMPKIVELAKHWESENITYGYIACSTETMDEFQVWVATSKDSVIGFLFGKRKISEGLCLIPIDSMYFEIEDFYLLPEFRDKGVGRMFYLHVEKQLINEGIKYILLSTATKDYTKIIKFYTEIVGFTVWSTTLFKQI